MLSNRGADEYQDGGEDGGRLERIEGPWEKINGDHGSGTVRIVLRGRMRLPAVLKTVF